MYFLIVRTFLVFLHAKCTSFLIMREHYLYFKAAECPKSFVFYHENHLKAVNKTL